MLENNKVNVFISYAWGTAEHMEWVQGLADKINFKGGNTIIDRKQKFGTNLRLFMVRNITTADIVLIIMSPDYKEKAENVTGGVGYEYYIISGNMFDSIKDNEKYIPVLREGNHETAVPNFLKGFKYVDLRQGGHYESELELLLEQIVKSPRETPELPVKKKPVMENQYKEIAKLTNQMKRSAAAHFKQLVLSEDSPFSAAKLMTTIEEWESKIKIYSDEAHNSFGPEKMEKYKKYPEDFKTKAFGKQLWTVDAALKSRDPDLSRYKRDFAEASAKEIWNIVQDILSRSQEYINEYGAKLNYRKISRSEELDLGYLDEEGMSMVRIIGYGIRSELLHRNFPANFPVMTQRSLWAMYFICDSAEEFISVEKKTREGLIRVSHNWQYPYERFTYLMNILANELESWLAEFKINLKSEYRFGYVNMFLAVIEAYYKKEIKELHKWEETGGHV